MNPTKPGWQTTEFWLALAGVAAKVVIVLVILGVIPAAQQESTTQAIVNLIIAVGGIIGISAGTQAYGRQRAEVKKAMMADQTRRLLAPRQHIPPNRPGVRR